MLRTVRSHFFNNVVGYIALFVALGGTGAYALSGSNTVFSDDIVNGQVKKPDLGANSVGPGKVADNSLTGSDIKPESVGGPRIIESTLDATPLRTRVAQGSCESTVPGTGQMVRAGPVCIDRYEVVVESKPSGGQEYGITGDDYPCKDNGQDCGGKIFARSVPGRRPSRYITWFQAQAALANSGKRLPTNAEWQLAVEGTPDSTACNVNSGNTQETGSNANCKSRFGAYDMVGNVEEWVADWVQPRTTCPGWDPSFSDDHMCFAGASATTKGPSALVRGGTFDYATSAGPFAVGAANLVQGAFSDVGFRGAR